MPKLITTWCYYGNGIYYLLKSKILNAVDRAYKLNSSGKKHFKGI